MKIGKLLLYHGSDQQVNIPEWNHGSRYRDFGHCFYTTHSRAMARDWAEKASLLTPVVNGYAIDFEVVETHNLRIKRFRANAEWAEFVYMGCRRARLSRAWRCSTACSRACLAR